MLHFLPGPIKGTIAAILLIVNTILACVFIYPLALLKAVFRFPSFQAGCTALMVRIGETWISINNAIARLMTIIHWDILGLENLDPERSYLVCSNHQSWVDIVILQKVFNHRIPFLRFFLKQELIYVPFLGWAWWALDFPFMKRYTREYLEKHPEKRGEDLKTTRKACERFKGSRISVLNFLEGTRFTQAKHDKQKSPYRHLLSPKAGGIAFVLDAMGEQFDSLLDVTIVYPEGVVTLWGLLSGRMREVRVDVRALPIPKDLLSGNYLEDESFRNRLQTWVRTIWDEKDRKIDSMSLAPTAR